MARTRKINLSRLKPEEKKHVWARIQQNNPALADLLKDKGFQSLRDTFEGEILVNASDLEVNHGQY